MKHEICLCPAHRELNKDIQKARMAVKENSEVLKLIGVELKEIEPKLVPVLKYFGK